MRFQQKPQSAGNLSSGILSQQQFFNQSFYNERIANQQQQPSLNTNHQTQSYGGQSTYISYQYVDKYFQATRINQLINKTVRTTLQSPYLPQNPYNMIGRLLLHDCIFQNIRAYYNMLAKDRSKLTNKILQIDSGNVNFNMRDAADFKKVMKDVKIGNNAYSVAWKLISILRQDRVNALWQLLFDPKTEPAKKKTKNRSKAATISYCLSGSLLLKVDSPYSCQQSVSPTHIFTISASQTNDHHQQFANYIIDDCIRLCQVPNNIFVKLYVYTRMPASTQWATDNLVHNRVKIVKEICKVCISGLDQIKADYLIKVPLQMVKIVGSTYLRITKTYILVQQLDKQTKIHSNSPSTLLLTSVFSSQSLYFHSLLKAFQNKGTLQQLVHQMHVQQHSNIIYSLQQQEPAWIGWALYWIGFYQSAENKGVDKELRASVRVMMDSPLGFIDNVRHQISVAKLMSSRSSSTNYQLQTIGMLQKCQALIISSIRNQQHIYPETVLFFQAVNRNLQLILQQQNKINKNIKPILQRIQLLFKYLLNSFYQICMVLKGHILNQIIKIDNEFGKDGSGEIISSTVTYDIFLRKYKDLPDRTLNISKHISKYRQQFQRNDDDIRQLILAKYVQKYQLYQRIYHFYWNIIIGKKLIYPMGQFVNMLRNQAIRFDSKRARKGRDSGNKIKFDIQETRTDGIMIYQKAADTRGEHLFYSLSVQSLQDQNIVNYRTIKQIFEQFFKNDILSQKSTVSLSHLQKNSYILSLSSQISRLKSQQSDFNKCKIYVDSIYNLPVDPKQIYRIMYQEIVQKLDLLEKNGFGVIGVYNGDKVFMDGDQVYPWTDNQNRYDINFLRYAPKKPLNIESVAKLLKSCKTSNSEVLIRGIFWLNGLLKLCEISMNFLINKEWLLNQSHSYKHRIFFSHEDIARWGNYNGLKQYIATQKQIAENPKFNRRQSSQQKYLSNHIDLIQFVAEDMDQPVQITRVRTYSPFYGQLEQSMSLVEGLFYLLEYVKIDRSGKFQVKDLKDTVDILQYYLFDKCLRMDRYIYSQGLSVTIINLVSRINKYIFQHSDNNGQQKQLIYLQKITIKLMNCIHYVLTSCAFGVIEAIQNQYIKPDAEESDSDDDDQQISNNNR